MTAHDLPSGMIRSAITTGTVEGYMPGFGNDFETEALPGAAAAGAELARRSATTASMPSSFPAPPSPRRAARTSGPGATASGPRCITPAASAAIDVPYWKTAPHILTDVISLGPVPLGSGPGAATRR